MKKTLIALALLAGVSFPASAKMVDNRMDPAEVLKLMELRVATDRECPHLSEYLDWLLWRSVHLKDQDAKEFDHVTVQVNREVIAFGEDVNKKREAEGKGEATWTECQYVALYLARHNYTLYNPNSSYCKETGYCRPKGVRKWSLPIKFQRQHYEWLKKEVDKPGWNAAKH